MDIMKFLRDAVRGADQKEAIENGEEDLSPEQILYGPTFDKYPYGHPQYEAQEDAKKRANFTTGQKWGYLLGGPGKAPALDMKPLPRGIQAPAMAAPPVQKRKERKKLSTNLADLIGVI